MVQNILSALNPDSICVYCEVIMSDCTRHCVICDRCVERYDHHCVWINNCVGLKNHNVYVVLLGALLVDFAWKLFLGIWSLFGLFSGTNSSCSHTLPFDLASVLSTSHAQLVGGLLLCVMLVLLVPCFVGVMYRVKH